MYKFILKKLENVIEQNIFYFYYTSNGAILEQSDCK